MGNDLGRQLADDAVSAENKERLINTFTQINNYALLAIFGTTVVGALMYGEEKRVQYGGGFSINKFWFG